jgi:hypothetical protein
MILSIRILECPGAPGIHRCFLFWGGAAFVIFDRPVRDAQIEVIFAIFANYEHNIISVVAAHPREHHPNLV